MLSFLSSSTVCVAVSATTLITDGFRAMETEPPCSMGGLSPVGTACRARVVCMHVVKVSDKSQRKFYKLLIDIYDCCIHVTTAKRSVREIMGYFAHYYDYLVCLFQTTFLQRLDWQDCSLAIGLQQGIETMFSILKRTTCDYLQKDSPTFSLDKGEENKICRGSTGGEKRSVAVTKAPLTSCVCAAIPTPPPDCSPRLASTLQKESKGFTHGESFVKGSTLDENSWGCSSEREDCSVAVQVQVRCEVEDETATGENGQERGSNKLSLKRIREVDSSEEDELPLPKNLKLPQSKLSRKRLYTCPFLQDT